MGNIIFDTIGTYRLEIPTGNVTTIAAATASAGHLLALRWVNATKRFRLRSLEVEFILTTAFGAAQEVGCDLTRATSYSAAHTAGTQIDGAGMGGRLRSTYDVSMLESEGSLRVATAAALTNGTETLDTNPLARTSMWMGAVGASLYQKWDFTASEPGGIILQANQGLIIRNSILMGASGVGRWTFTPTWDEGLVGN